VPILSAAIITLNEASRIEACLSALSFCDEIVLLDSGSSDGTLDLARRFTDRLYLEPFKGDGAQKNSVVAKTRGQWVLLVDADEIVTPSLANEITGVVNNYGNMTTIKKESPAAWAVPRRNHFGGVWVRHGGWYPDYQIRLWLNGRARFLEHEVHPGVKVDGKVDRLKEPLLHYTYDSEEDYLARMKVYARGRAEDYFRLGRQCRPWTPFSHQTAAFIRAFFWRAGFLDGRLGWRLACLAARYTRLKYDHLRTMLLAPPASSPGRSS